MKSYIWIKDPDFNKKIPQNKKGVYKLYSLDIQHKPIPINRVLGTDIEGVLYIGCTPDRTLQERLADFRKTISRDYKSQNHTAGRKYIAMSKFQQKFPFDTLAILTEITEEPEKRERELVKQYTQKFGEEPPLNSH